jgi:hypothetical protein
VAQGYIKLHRQLMEHKFWRDKRKFSKAEAWIDLIFMANHKDNKFLLGNQWVKVVRGSFITSELKLMERWGWSKAKTRAFLFLLEDDQMIVKKSDRQKTTITIVNYGIYQDYQTTEKPQKDHEETTKRPRRDTNNNDKRMIKNDKEIYRSMFDEFWSQYPKKQAKQDAVRAWDKIKMTEDLYTTIMEGLSKSKQSKQWAEGYIPNPATWLNGRRWEDEYTPNKESNLINGHRF